MFLAFSVNGVPIRLTKERLDHIYMNHPELNDSENRILETLNNPDIVQKEMLGHFLQ